jgi:ATP-independent RNA helicase DbpA
MSRLRHLETERESGAMKLWRSDSMDAPASNVTESMPEPSVYTLEINGGRKQKLRPGDILGTLTASKELSADAVGKIDILPMVSYVAIAKEHSSTAQRLINRHKIKGRQYRARGLG